VVDVAKQPCNRLALTAAVFRGCRRKDLYHVTLQYLV
jgi:hypothetical protein